MPAFDSTRLAAARLKAADAQPFLALALYALSAVPSPGSGTFSVDERWRLFVDPDALARWSVDEVAGVLLHEVGHVVRGHAERARVIGVGEGSHRRWNLAADAEINDDLIADGVALPPDPVVPRGLGLPPGRAAEFYFFRMADPAPLEGPDCGPGAHGFDDDPLAPSGDGAGLTTAEVLLVRRRVAEAIFHQVGAQAGSVAGGWERWAEATLRPQVDWRRVLDGAVRNAVAAVAGRSDYSYRRPSRRRATGVVLPSMQRPVPRVSVVVDTSGSVDDHQLDVAWTEVEGCLRGIGVRRDLIRVYATDTVTRRVSAGSRRALLTGGGGTDMARGIADALGDRPGSDLVVVITDGETPWPPTRPARPVVVALLQSDRPVPPVPSWATTVRVRVGDT